MAFHKISKAEAKERKEARAMAEMRGYVKCENCLKLYNSAEKVCRWCKTINYELFERDHRFRTYQQTDEIE